MNSITREQLEWLIEQDYRQKLIDIDEYYRLRRLYGLLSVGVKSCAVCGSASPESAVHCWRCQAMFSANSVAGIIRLRGITGQFAGQLLSFSNQVTIGRDPGACNLSLSEQAEMVSRKHASITFDPSTQEYILQNHSTNGTFLQNDGQLQQIDCRALRPGERFCLANVANSFEFNG